MASPAEPPGSAALRGGLKPGAVAPSGSVPSWIQQDKLDPDKARAHDCILRGTGQTRQACCVVCLTLLSQLQKARHHGTHISISWAPLNRHSELRAAQQPRHLSHNAPQPAIRALTRIFLYSWTAAATGG